MTEDEKRRQQATQFASKQERSSAPKVQGASKAASNIAPKAYSAGQGSSLRQTGGVEGAPRSAPQTIRRDYDAGDSSSLRQPARRLDGKASSIGQSANNRPRGASLLQPSATTPDTTASRDVAQTVADFTAGGIDQNIIGDQLDGAQDEEKDLFDDIFGLDDEDEDEYNFNPNYLA